MLEKRKVRTCSTCSACSEDGEEEFGEGDCPAECDSDCEEYETVPVWSVKYTPYGLTYDLEGGTFVFNLRQPGQYFDAETGFYYNGQRYYIPDMRRYNRPEPIGQAGSLDLYMYAGGCPVMRIDPTGLFWKEILGYDDESGPSVIGSIAHGFDAVGEFVGSYAYHAGVGSDTADPKVVSGLIGDSLSNDYCDKHECLTPTSPPGNPKAKLHSTRSVVDDEIKWSPQSSPSTNSIKTSYEYRNAEHYWLNRMSVEGASYGDTDQYSLSSNSTNSVSQGGGRSVKAAIWITIDIGYSVGFKGFIQYPLQENGTWHSLSKSSSPFIRNSADMLWQNPSTKPTWQELYWGVRGAWDGVIGAEPTR